MLHDPARHGSPNQRSGCPSASQFFIFLAASRLAGLSLFESPAASKLTSQIVLARTKSNSFLL
jgi:hypothetical protein